MPPSARSASAHTLVSHALVVATGVSIEGTREVLGTAVGDTESYEFWREFLASLEARGLSGVHLVISDAHAELKAAVAQQFTGSSWQRCRVHYSDLSAMPTSGWPVLVGVFSGPATAA